jgi:integrase
MEFTSVTLTEEEKALLEELRQKWRRYHHDPLLKKGSTNAYQQLQERQLSLLVLPEWEAVEEFDTRRDTLNWSAATTSQYWSALRSAAHKIGILLPQTFAHRGKVLQYLVKEEDETRPTTEATAEQITAARTHLPVRLGIALQLAFDLGQRMGDTIQVEKRRVTSTHDPSSQLHFATVMYRRGKTVRRRDPFSLHIPPHNPLAQDILALAASTQTDWLFAPTDGRTGALNEILAALKKVNKDLGLLSVRRGGLQAMAKAGATVETLLHHSRHTTLQLLNRYLEWGRYNMVAARELATITQADAGKSTQ